MRKQVACSSALKLTNLVTELDKVSFKKVPDSEDLNLKFYSGNGSLMGDYRLSKELVDQFDYFKAQIRFIDVQVIQESDLGPEMYSLWDSVLSQCPQGEVIGCDKFEKQLKAYVSENLSSPSLIADVYKALHYFGYSQVEAFQGLKLCKGTEINLSVDKASLKITGSESLRSNELFLFIEELKGIVDQVEMKCEGQSVEDMKQALSLFPSLLVYLDLSANKLSADGASALATVLTALTNLQTLVLSDNKLGADGATSLSGVLSGLTGLESLNLNRNQIGDDGASALASSLLRLTKLQSLDLGINEIDDAGASSLSGALTCLTALESLNLAFNQIRDAGASSLAGVLSGLTRLTSLDIGYNRIGAAGAEELIRRLNHITGLHIKMNLI